MNPATLASLLKDCQKAGDSEDIHSAMDNVLMEFLEQIGYQEAVEIFKNTPKWYS